VAKLAVALCSAIESVLRASSDQITRVEVPRSWPVREAIAQLLSKYPQTRVGLLRGYPIALTSGLKVKTSDSAQQITAWRNNRNRTTPLVIFGKATGESAAGLRDFARVVLRKHVIAAWRDIEGDYAATLCGKPEVARMVTCLLDHAESGDIDAVALDDYLTAIGKITPHNINPVFKEMWRARLIPDDQAIDKGNTKRRIDSNLELVSLLEADEERGTRSRLRKAAAAGGKSVNSARAALDFIKTRDSSHLKRAQLEDIKRILAKEGNGGTADKTADVFELLNGPDTTVITDALGELNTKWHLEDAELKPVETDASFGDDVLRCRITLSAPTGEVVDQDGSSLKQMEARWFGPGDEQTLVAEVSGEKPEPCDESSQQLSGRTASDLSDALESHTEPGSAAALAALEKYRRARRALKDYCPWLLYNARELLLVCPEARKDVRRFLDAWSEMVAAFVDLSSPGRILPLVQLLECTCGPTLQDPHWVVLGPLHPYRLDPLLRVAEHAIRELRLGNGKNLGDAVRWLLDRCYPAYPALYFGDRPMHLAGVEPWPVYLSQSQEHLPRADEGRGLSHALECILGFAPGLKSGLGLALIDPPPGSAILSEVRRVQSATDGRTRVVVVSTRSDSNPLDDADGEVRYVGGFDSLARFAQETNSAFHVLVRFTPQPKGSVAARQGWSATRGSFLAPHLEISKDPLEREMSPVAYVKIEPRSNNGVVCAIQELYRKQTGNSPKHFQFRPMLPAEEISAFKSFSERADWLIVGAPGPMGLATPARINTELNFVGREALGPYGLYIYSTDGLFTVRRYIESELKSMPVTISAEQQSEQLTQLAKQSGAAILRMGRDGIQEHQAALVALDAARRSSDPDRYLDVILRVDDLGWTRIWISERLRCDFLLVRIAQVAEPVTPRISICGIESKSSKQSEPIAMSRSSMAESIEQIRETIGSLQQVIHGSDPTLDEDVRFAAFIEHVMAAVLASDPDFTKKERIQRAVDVLNRFAGRQLNSEDIAFSGLGVMTQASTNADGDECTVEVDGLPIRLVRATARHVTTLFGGEPGVSQATVTADPDAARVDVVVERQDDADAQDTEDDTEAGEEQGTGTATTISTTTSVSPDAAWAERKARDLVLICRRHQIPIADPVPSRVVLGPSLVAVSVRLKVGAQISTIEKRIEDLMRDIGMGDRAQEVTVMNDAEPSTVRFLLPRANREFPELPSIKLNPVADGNYLPLRIGMTLDGKHHVSAVESWPHMLVAGSTGSGKTTFLRTILRQLSSFGPDVVRVVIVDGKGDTDYMGAVPSNMFADKFPDPLLGHEHVDDVLKWALSEMERRRTVLHEIAKKSANPSAMKWPEVFKARLREGRRPEVTPLIILIDEFADLMMSGRQRTEEFLTSIQRLAQVGRSRLMHLILATQRPDKETIKGAIKSNLDARVALRLPKAADSITVLGRGGAERLLKYGDMIFEVGGAPERLQGYKD